jgi:2-dehydropantoate 2-reductase
MDSIQFQETVAVRWAADPVAVSGARLVLFCVKAVDNEEAARQIAPHLKSAAVVASLQNGVDNVERLRAASGIDALPAVVYVAASMTAPDRVKHAGRGDLLVGELGAGASDAPTERVRLVAETFERAGVPCVVSDNIAGALWQKLIMNCAGNALSAIARAPYGIIAGHAPSREVIGAVISECVAVARAAGVRLPEMDFYATAMKLVSGDLSRATSSTEQDIARGRRTEIDSLNGYVARRGAALGVPTPVNSTLTAMVKLLEESSGK